MMQQSPSYGFNLPAACERPGRGSGSPLDCHLLPRLRFAYPLHKGAFYQNALATSSSSSRMESFWGHCSSHWPQPTQESALFSYAA